MMWDGLRNYNAGSLNYSSRRKSAAVPQKLSSAGMGNIAPCYELKERPQVDLAPTASPQFTAIATIYSRLITCPNYKRSWLQNSTEPLSDCDHTTIHTILHLRTASQSGAFFAMAVALLLVFGIATWKDLPKVLHFDNLHPVARSQAWR